MEDVIMIVISLLPCLLFLFFGIFLLVLSIRLKHKQSLPNPNIVNATVIDSQDEGIRDFNNYLRFQYSKTTVKYEHDGKIKTNSFLSFNKYDVGSVIKIKVSSNGSINVVDGVPTFTGRANTRILKGHEAAKIIGWICICISALFAIKPVGLILSTLIDASSKTNFFNFVKLCGMILLFGGFILVFFFLGIQAFKKARQTKQDFANYQFNKLTAKITDIRRVTKTDSDHHTDYSYHPIVEYFDGSNMVSAEIMEDSKYRLNDIGKTIDIYKHRGTGEILLSPSTSKLFMQAYVFFGVAIMATIIVVVSLCNNPPFA